VVRCNVASRLSLGDGSNHSNAAGGPTSAAVVDMLVGMQPVLTQPIPAALSSLLADEDLHYILVPLPTSICKSWKLAGCSP
jgi:hypothetical protein